ncbi:MAG: hypothetical protein JW889_12790 [Verrucomicrobia bacterium]|nr:hypothetical protein [Verrucomicrobiota bacterium]
MNNKKVTYLVVGAAVLAALVIGFVVQWSQVKGDPSTDLTKRLGAWTAAFCVFAVLSYLYAENAVYRLFEHALLGFGTGMGIALTIQEVIIDKWWVPIVAAVKAFSAGTQTGQSYYDICLIFAAFFGMLMYFQFSKKYLWLSRITIGITAGMGAGLAIKGTAITMMPQITSTFKMFILRPSLAPNLSAAGQGLYMVESFLLILVVCCVLYYFFFSFRRDSALAKAPANLGRFFLMISFGAFFGNTFMTRVVLLIERIQFLLHDWLMVN